MDSDTGESTIGGPGDDAPFERPFRQIVAMLARSDGDQRQFPPTLLYNEGWLLRLVLDWFCTTQVQGHPLNFAPGARWFSEARLASRYMARAGSPESRAYAEGFTHADGVIGHFDLGSPDRSDAVLASSATQFIVTEAKLGSALSPGIRNAPAFDQAARNVACMAHLCSKHDVRAGPLKTFAFYVIAPEVRIKAGFFDALLTRSSLREKVRTREAGYPPHAPDGWFEQWFEPLLEAMAIEAISWESVIEFIAKSDAGFAFEMSRFYQRCRTFNAVEDEPTVR